MNATIQTVQTKGVPTDVDPIPVWQALLYFGLPTLLFAYFCIAAFQDSYGQD